MKLKQKNSVFLNGLLHREHCVTKRKHLTISLQNTFKYEIVTASKK